MSALSIRIYDADSDDINKPTPRVEVVAYQGVKIDRPFKSSSARDAYVQGLKDAVEVADLAVKFEVSTS